MLWILITVFALASTITTAKPLNNIRELHQNYKNVFKHGNRNAASHKWASFILRDSQQYTDAKMQEIFTGFCAISGSPVSPSDYKRYGLTIPVVSELAAERNFTSRFGYLYYCCWPCVCDTQDFLRIDSKTITTKDGPKEHWFVTIGNPCKHAEKLKEKFYQPFDRGMVTLASTAPEVRCNSGELEEAILSDHGYIIIGMFFDSEPVEALPDRYLSNSTAISTDVQPGRMSTHALTKVKYQSEYEFDKQCDDRKRNGYNSGMGEIFRKVAEINTISLPALPSPVGSKSAAGTPPGTQTQPGSCKNESESCGDTFKIEL